MSTSTEGTSFSDECRLVCLCYLKDVSSKDRDFDKEDLRQFHKIIDRQILRIDADIDDFDSVAQSLVELSLKFEITMIGKVANSVKMMWHCDITDLSFDLAANTLLEESFVENWNHIALLLHLIYRTTRVRDIDDFNEIIDLGVRFLEDSSFNFISNCGGWNFVMNQEEEPSEQEEILSSIVMVRPEKSPEDQLDIPPSETPPMMLPPINDYEERESWSSATPPEIVDRPPMTASLMQMMGGGDAPLNLNGASSDSTDFEMVGSITSAVDSTPSSPPELKEKEKEDNAKELESRELTKQSLLSQFKSFTGSATSSCAPDAPEEPASVSDYIPQITIGVAAAAACIGLFMLKKSS